MEGDMDLSDLERLYFPVEPGYPVGTVPATPEDLKNMWKPIKNDNDQQQRRHQRLPTDAERKAGENAGRPITFTRFLNQMRLNASDKAREYVRQIQESEGFDIDFVFNDWYDTIVPIPSEIISDKNRVDTCINENHAKLAIHDFNVKHGTCYEFVRLVKVNVGAVSGVMYYITFMAKDRRGSNDDVEFQAKVLDRSFIPDFEPEVLLCRTKGGQTTTPTFGSQRGGSRLAAYTPTADIDIGNTTLVVTGKLESISAMPAYKGKSQEELRWEDYKMGDKGGLDSPDQADGASNFCASNTRLSPFSSPFTYDQSCASSFPSATAPNIFAPETPSFVTPGFGSSSSPTFGSSGFGALSTSKPFGSTSSTAPSIVGSTNPTFGASPAPSLFGSLGSSAFGSSTSVFGSASAQGTRQTLNCGLNLVNTQSSPLFQSTAISFGQHSHTFGQTCSAFVQSASGFGQSNLFSTPSTCFGVNLSSSTPSLLQSSSQIKFGQTMDVNGVDEANSNSEANGKDGHSGSGAKFQ